MGNQPSSSSSSCIDIEHPRPFSRIVGSLGLNQNQLDKRTQNSGLYNNCKWDDKVIRRLIADGRLAARMKGDECCRNGTEECPICFLDYSEVNVTKCCNANICTECYLQVRPQKEKLSTCPFCNCDNLSVVVVKKKKGTSSSSSLSTASLSASTSSISSSSSLTSGSSKHKGSSPVVSSVKKKSAASVSPHSPTLTKKSTGFGSHLEQDERFKMTKKRSESFASNEISPTPKTENEIIKSIAMTTEERKRLEDEMRAQHFHPLVLGLEAEAQERRLENDRAYRNSTGGRNNTNSINVGSGTRRMRLRGGESTRDWHQLANFFERGDDANSLDDMVALEAAIMFSMGEDRPTVSLSTNGEDNNNINNNNNESARNSSHEGFPLLRSLLTGQLNNNGSESSAVREDDSSTAGTRNLNSSRRGRGQPIRSSLGGFSATRHRGMGGMGSAALDAAALMMRGISEDDQISMAIAASLQDQSDSNNNDDLGEDQEGEEEHTNGTSSSKSIASSGSIKVQQELVEASSSSSSSSSSIPLIELKQLGVVSNGGGDEASTITELARVVTDSASTDEKVSSDGTVNKDTTPNGIAA